MKKIFAVVCVFALSACWSGGRLDLWDWRNSWIENLGSYGIDYFDQGPKHLSREMKTVKEFTPNKVKTAYKGYSIASVRTYQKDIYASSAARINMDGALSSAAAPVRFKKGDQRAVIGMTEIDGEELYIVPSDIESFVFLIHDDGRFFRHMGQIRNDRLRLIRETTYFATPAELRFEPVTNSSTKQTEPIKGFELKFDGLNGKKVSFLYFDFSGFGGKNGYFETFNFPNKESEVNINGIRVKILRADDQKLDYMIVE